MSDGRRGLIEFGVVVLLVLLVVIATLILLGPQISPGPDTIINNL